MTVNNIRSPMLGQAVTGLIPPNMGEAQIRDVSAGVKAVVPSVANLAKFLLHLPSNVAEMLPSIPIVTAVLWPIVWTALALVCLPAAAVLLLLIWPVHWVLATIGSFFGIFAAIAIALTTEPVPNILLVPFFIGVWLVCLFVMLPTFCKRYTLTNRRLMVRRGLQPRVYREIPLTEIDEVREVPGTFDPFYLSANLDILSKGNLAFCLTAVPEPESFRLAILTAVQAWGKKIVV